MKKDYKLIFMMIVAVAAVICLCVLDFHSSANRRNENAENNKSSSVEVEKTSKPESSTNANNNINENENEKENVSKEDSESSGTSSPEATSAPKLDLTMIGEYNKDFIPTDYDDQNQAFSDSYTQAYQYCQDMKNKGVNMVVVEVYDGNEFVGYGCRDNTSYEYSTDEKNPSRAVPLGDYYAEKGASDNG